MSNRYCVKCERINPSYRVSEYETYTFYYCQTCGGQLREFQLIGRELPTIKFDRFAVLFEEDLPTYTDNSYYEILNEPLAGSHLNDETKGWIRFSQLMGEIPVHYRFNGVLLKVTAYSDESSIYQEYIKN